MKLSQLNLSAAKHYFFGLATSGLVLFSTFYFLNTKIPSENSPSSEQIDFVKAELIPLEPFNPNTLDEEGWKKLGFSSNKISTILKYKDIVGGEFTSKAQLKKCYAISSEKFSEIESFILLPEEAEQKSSYRQTRFAGNNYNNNNYRKSNYSPKKSLNISGKFNPDHLSAIDFENMGFTERQAQSILKYKNYLGGSFQSKEKFKACFIISDEQYRKMEPFLLLPQTAPESDRKYNFYSSAKADKPIIKYQIFDPNTTDLNGWKLLGFSAKQAQVIINYRDRNLKGSFKSLDEIERCFVISAEKFTELKPFITLMPENLQSSTTPRSNSNYIQESKGSSQETETDFSKVDLNKITYKQLSEFGFDGKSAAMILGFRKKLGGFMTKQQLVDTYEIDKELAQKLVLIAPLDISSVAKYTLVDAPEDWLKNHPYFKYSADRIIYYRLTNDEDKKIWKLLKTKPEYADRMKLYLK